MFQLKFCKKKEVGGGGGGEKGGGGGGGGGAKKFQRGTCPLLPAPMIILPVFVVVN